MAVAGSIVPGFARAEGDPPFCSAEGGEHLTPALSQDEACTAFAAALDTALDTALTDAGAAPASHPPITVALHFTRTGVSRAEVRHAGESERWFEVNFAVMDRDLPAAAIERLAAQVARELMAR